MPEGPEIRLAADKIFTAIGNRSLTRLWFEFNNLKPYESLLVGQKVVEIETRGKAMLTHFTNDLTLYSHNQLYGRWIVKKTGDPPKTNRSLRVALQTSSKSAYLYSATTIELLKSNSLERHSFLSKLGPDILNRLLTQDRIVEILLNKRFRNRSLGSIFLDQSFLAGLGNYLRSEILHTSGLSPFISPAKIKFDQLQRLAEQTLSIPMLSYQNNGVTLNPALVKLLKHDGEQYKHYRFWVFSRENLPCRICGSLIVKTTHSSRNLFYCPTCQPIN